MLKVVFATPPLTMEERYGTLAGAGSSAPTLGILMLAAVVRESGFSSAVIDAAALDLTLLEVLTKIEEERPDVLGISATTLSIFHAESLAVAVKERFPAIRVVIGGPHVSAMPLETMARFPVFDVAVVGEGEETIVELLNAFSGEGRLADVKGIAYRDGDHVLVNERRPFIKELDKLPFPAWDLLEGFPQRYAPAPFKVRKLPAASLVTSRGCPNLCIFCDRSVFGASCHAFSAQYVVEMIRDLYTRYGVQEFSFEDDTFITFRKRLVEICERLLALKLNISWSCLGRVNHVDRETLALMRRAGCWQVSFGIESGSQEILENIRKKVTLDQIREALRLSREAGLLNKGFFIVGHPGETRETLQKTLDFILELPLDDISVTMLTPFPGTELYERGGEFGMLDRDWSRMNLLTPLFVPHGLTRRELEEAQKEMIRRFYLRPSTIVNYAGRVVRNPAMVKGLWKGFVSFLRSV